MSEQFADYIDTCESGIPLSDEITIDINDKLNCSIYSGRASFSMFAMRGEDFPNLPELTADKGFEINSETLKFMIGKVALPSLISFMVGLPRSSMSE